MTQSMASGQQDALGVLTAALRNLDGSNIRYSYTLTLMEQQSHHVLSTLSGVLQKNGVDYLDSNALLINTRVGSYTLQVHCEKRAMYLKSLDRIAKLAKRPVPSESPLLFATKYLKPSNIMGSSNHNDRDGNMVFTVQLQGVSFRKITATISPGNQLLNLEIQAIESDRSGNYLRVLAMSHFGVVEKGGIPALKNYLVIRKGKAVAAGKYQNYSVVKII